MKRAFLQLIILTLLASCREKEVDPSIRVRPVGLQIAVTGSEYKLSWEGYRIVCITSPCPDVADVEAEEYEIQVALDELGPFQTYKTVDADRTSLAIPIAKQGQQLVARIISKAKGAPPVSSDAVMATSGFLSKTAFYPGFGSSPNVMGLDVTPDGKRAAYTEFIDDASGQYKVPMYLAELQNEQPVSKKLIAPVGGVLTFSQDGQRFAYFSGTEKGIVIYEVATGQARTIPVENMNFIQGLSWSPDEKWFAFSTVSDEESRLWKIAVTGGPVIPLTPAMPGRELNNIRHTGIDWSPDGQHIAVSRARSETAGKDWRETISFYSPGGSGEVHYFETQPGWIDTNPSFSPDGKQLAFLSTRTAPGAMTYSLWVRDLGTGKSRRIELLPGLVPSEDYVPRWLGNERLLFLASQEGKRGYFTAFL